MTKCAKTASGLCVRFSLWMKGIALDSQNGQQSNGLIFTTAENGRIKTMISREEAIERLKDMRDEAQGWNDTLFTVSGKLAHSFEVDVQSLDMAIEALSQPERPKGRWEQFMFFKTIKQCSICNCTTDCTPNYCPNCGAEMVRGEEECI